MNEQTEQNYIPTDDQLTAVADPNSGIIDSEDIAKGDDRPVFVGPAICKLTGAKWIRRDGSSALKMLLVWETESDVTDTAGVSYAPGQTITDFVTVKADPVKKDGTPANVEVIERMGFETIEKTYLSMMGKFTGRGGATFKPEVAAKLKSDLIEEGYRAASKDDVKNPNIVKMLGQSVKQEFKARWNKVNGVEDRTQPANQGFSPRAVKKA